MFNSISNLFSSVSFYGISFKMKDGGYSKKIHSIISSFLLRLIGILCSPISSILPSRLCTLFLATINDLCTRMKFWVGKMSSKFFRLSKVTKRVSLQTKRTYSFKPSMKRISSKLTFTILPSTLIEKKSLLVVGTMSVFSCVRR